VWKRVTNTYPQFSATEINKATRKLPTRGIRNGPRPSLLPTPSLSPLLTPSPAPRRRLPRFYLHSGAEDV